MYNLLKNNRVIYCIANVIYLLRAAMTAAVAVLDLLLHFLLIQNKKKIPEIMKCDGSLKDICKSLYLDISYYYHLFIFKLLST